MSAITCPLNNRACRCDPAVEKLKPCMLAKRIGQLMALEASSEENEAIAAMRALRRTLPAEGLTFNDIRILVENCDGKIEALQYSDDDLANRYAMGIEEGRKQGAASAGPIVSTQFFDKDSRPKFQEMAAWCHAAPAKATLKPNEQEFIDEIQVKLRYRAPTPPMGGYLLSIFWKLRGSFK